MKQLMSGKLLAARVGSAIKKRLRRYLVSGHSAPRALTWTIAGLVLLVLACNAVTTLGTSEDPEGDKTPEETSDGEQDYGMSLEAALAVEVEDRRNEVLRLMGAPDAFTLVFEELQGQVVRSEQWSYFDFESRFDFVDGELLWTVELEPVPDGSIYAHFYDPREFTAYMSAAEVHNLLADETLEEIELDEGDIPGGLVLVGDQIILGFDQDRLVYAETIILSPVQAP